MAKDKKEAGTKNNWEMTSAMGELVLPAMNMLSQKLPQLVGATLCTADGFNVCSIGMENSDVGKMSSLSSSMFAITNSVMETMTRNQGSDKKEVLVTAGKMHVVLIQVSHPSLNDLVLLVSVENTSTGVLLVAIRYIVTELEKALLAVVS